MERNQVSNVAWTVREPPDILLKGRRIAVADLGVLDLSLEGSLLDEALGDISDRMLPYDIDFKGRLIAAFAIVEEATTATDADGTLDAAVNDNPVAGGTIVLADVNDGNDAVDAVNKVLQGTLIYNDNEVIPGDTVTVIFETDSDYEEFLDGKIRLYHVYETETA